MHYLMLVLILALNFSVGTFQSFAQDASPTVSMSPTPNSSPVMMASPSPTESGVSHFAKSLQDVAQKIPTTGTVITALLFVYDFVRRKWPTKDPASLLKDLKALFKGIIALLNKLDDFIDAIIGQNSGDK